MNPEPKKLSTDPYKGVRDFYPEDMFVLNYITSTMRSVVEKFGYQEYSASILEPTDLYRSKTSDEIVNEQTYSFKDRGDRDVTLRPEMTPTVARMIAGKRRDIPFPARWYSIPNVFRYEQPQRGRLREHWQLNVDLFGINSLEADVEIITIAYNLLKSFGAQDTDFVIKINNKNTVRKIIERELAGEDVRKYLTLLDKRAKIGEEAFKEEQEKAFGKVVNYDIAEAAESTKEIIDTLIHRGIGSVEFDPYMVRGFDYYTGTVFEVFDTNPENRRSLFGGGRYDNLTANFGGDPIPAIGFGAGDVGIRDFLEVHNLMPEYTSSADLFIATIGDVITDAQKLAQQLRTAGVNVAVNLTDKKVGDQLKNADKQKIPFVLVVGEDELKNNEFTIKNLATGEEVKRTSVQEIVEVVKSR